MVQAIILVTGALAIWCTQFGDPSLLKWACIVGMPGQPFWLYLTFRAKQWGMLALSVFYTGAWALGIWNFWLKPLVLA